jgi:cerevisin
MDSAVDAAVESGLFVGVAAGNDARDACQYSPAASKLAVTVGASDIADSIAYFSNHGKCVDIFAPGKDILGAWLGPRGDETNTISGTSMSSPHITALAALIMSEPQYANYTPKQLKEFIIEESTKNMIRGLPGWSKTPNRLIYNGAESGTDWDSEYVIQVQK